PNRIVATFSDGKSSSVAIPKDQFFLSIAPYINSSHPCTNHVLTGCTGEIKNQVMKVVMIDTDTGETLIDKKVTTQRDGFIDFWVPKNKNLAFNIYHKAKDGSERVAREVLSTFNNDRTCITTMQLIES
ncbi:CueP family metal-binding protein, partial [Shewanella sp. SG44-6]